jgi:hypothetical protein
MTDLHSMSAGRNAADMLPPCPYCQAPGVHIAARSANGPCTSWHCGTGAIAGRMMRGETCQLRAKVLTLQREIEKIRAVMDEQVNDADLGRVARTEAEAYLQQELRRLHAVIRAR